MFLNIENKKIIMKIKKIIIQVICAAWSPISFYCIMGAVKRCRYFFLFVVVLLTFCGCAGTVPDSV